MSGIGTIKFVLTYQMGGTSSEFIYSSRIIVTSDMAAISFRLYVGGVQMDEKTVLLSMTDRMASRVTRVILAHREKTVLS